MAANDADEILPVDVYIPGCPPHPWAIIHGILVAMGKAEPEPPIVLRKQDRPAKQ